MDGDRVTGGKPGKDYQALRATGIRHQESPLWIRPDGVVRNGNRRLAMLKRLQREKGLEGYEYVDAVVLHPDEIDEVALFDMEQREQLTENLKVRYTDINLLLAIRAAAEARGIDWSDPEDIDRVAGELQHIIGNNRAYAVVQLNAIKYMDAYLEDSGQPGQYHKLIDQIERFRDVGRVMAQVEQNYPDDASICCGCYLRLSARAVHMERSATCAGCSGKIVTATVNWSAKSMRSSRSGRHAATRRSSPTPSASRRKSLSGDEDEAEDRAAWT